jgi:archaeosine synthase
VRFEILERDGLARVGCLEIDGAKFETPTIAFVDSARYQAPRGSLRVRMDESASKGDLKVQPSLFVHETDTRLADGKLHLGYRGSPYSSESLVSDVIAVQDVSSLMLDSRRFVDAIERLKSGADLLKPSYCSAMGLPHRLAFLSYCGFDVFDSIPLIMAAENGSYLTSSGALAYDRIKHLPCSCPACSSGIRGKPELLAHNCSAAENELKLVRHTITEGKLRELVETRVRTDPWLVQNLRLLDLEHHELQEIHAPVKGSAFLAGSKESLSRPDIVRWKRRLVERYRRPEGADILLLIPCSAKKPYSLSHSHMRFREAIWNSGCALAVHEVIVTSPLGLVPRELEMFYPAKDYDIPVTGHWDADEKKLAEDMVSWLVSSQKYSLVISHLGDERDPVNSILHDFIDTSHGRPGSREGLDLLEKTLRERAPGAGGQNRKTRNLAEIRSIVRFQFGAAGEALCEDAATSGRWPNVRIMKSGKQVGMITGDRGMIALTIDGASVLVRQNAYTVEIDDFKPKGNLFAIGVEDASPEIRIGDDVAVAHGGDTRAAGVARMCAAEMVLAERGEAVHIRHAV